MKAYKVEILIVDFDQLGADGIKQELENTRFANDCLSANVMAVKQADIGPWDDSHPLNYKSTMRAEYERLFPQ